MSTREIARTSWPSFLDAFTRQHRGWLVTLTRDGRHLADDEPLEFARADGGAILVAAGDHRVRVDGADAIRVTAAGADESAIGHVTISAPNDSLTIRFRTVIAPELVDGVT